MENLLNKIRIKFMGFFDKLKQKVGDAVSSATDAMGFDRLKDGLTKTRTSFVSKIQGAIGIGRKIDAALLEEIEEILISADIGVNTTELIIQSLRKRVKEEGFENAEDVFLLLKEEMQKILIESPSADNDANYSIDEDKKPHVIMVIGVNGVGKTTTIGKLAFNYKNANRKVIIGAADTFRAAANEQLEIWAERAGVEIVQQKHGADPSAVVFDTVNAAISRKADVVIIDTAGRLHNKGNLMAELEKMVRVMKKIKDSAPDDVFLVLDSTTGQNAIQQAREFQKVANLTGIVLTKLDGTAKGGVVIPIATELKLPVRYIGVGEKINDLQVFSPSAFIEALFETETNEKN
ncbi:MAG: signal recognition particle-docking protein FtsY [Bacteroidota bacterium]